MKDIWIPSTIFNFLTEGKIKPTDVVLYGMICTMIGTEEGTSNESLASVLNVTPRHISRGIRRLKNIGVILTSYDMSGRRLIEVTGV